MQMTNAKTEKLLEQLAVQTPKLLAEHGFKSDVCILSTRLILHVLASYGIPATALDCKVSVLNQEYLAMHEHLQDREHLTSEDLQDEFLERGAWHVAIGHRLNGEPDLGGYDGHVVAAVKNRWIVDATIQQAARPKKNIWTEPGVFTPEKSFFKASSISFPSALSDLNF